MTKKQDIIDIMQDALDKMRDEADRAEKLTAEQLRLELANGLALLRRVSATGRSARDLATMRARWAKILRVA